jgi:hypothetical protein
VVSFISFLVGSLIRLFTTITQLRGDPLIMASMAVSIAANVIIIAQIYMYRHNTRAEADARRRATAQALPLAPPSSSASPTTAPSNAPSSAVIKRD